ncbi:oxidoreductase-like domain-containing protein [Parachitinimonas caeni]|uniref:Oxidoreductase-like domain-containing protein n=1 Tax=Parachitinimonas caeni TaxID=3031301 RepID=A0ABT7DZ29_9NEIS|nr:oxidoreductase-like domain-containing protein [Parachitinimonas caeni]MDK2125079.1 oxidoreductase-like domain-containing protein [Parachitinimonas caeni]
MQIPPRPEPPVAPDPAQCCDSGCQPCIWDLYNEEVAQYRQALAEWEARYGGRLASPIQGEPHIPPA